MFAAKRSESERFMMFFQNNCQVDEKSVSNRKDKCAAAVKRTEKVLRPFSDLRSRTGMMVRVAYDFACQKDLIRGNRIEMDLDFSKTVDYKAWIRLRDIFGDFELEDFQSFMLAIIHDEKRYSHLVLKSVDSSYCELALGLLRPECCADRVIGSGSGAMIFACMLMERTDAAAGFPFAKTIAFEDGVSDLTAANMIAGVLGDGSCDVFRSSIPECSEIGGAHYVSLAKRTRHRASLDSPKLSEWERIVRIIMKSAPKRMVALVSAKAIEGGQDGKCFGEFIARGYVEGVVELPLLSDDASESKLFMVVIEKKAGRDSVKVVDGSAFYECGANGRNKMLVGKICSKYFSADVETLSLVDYSNMLRKSPSFAIHHENNRYERGMRLGDHAEIFSGCQHTADAFAKKGLISENPSQFKLLSPGDIHDGFIFRETLANAKNCCDMAKYEKYALRCNDIVICVKSSKVKAAIVDWHPEERIIAIGGMLVIRMIDGSGVDPWYLRMFLDSDKGRQALSAAISENGSVFASSDDLKDIEVPFAGLDKQVRIAKAYERKSRRAFKCRMEALRLENEMRSMSDNAFG